MVATLDHYTKKLGKQENYKDIRCDIWTVLRAFDPCGSMFITYISYFYHILTVNAIDSLFLTLRSTPFRNEKTYFDAFHNHSADQVPTLHTFK